MALGLGSVVSSAVATAPWLVTVSRHKNLVFAVSGLLLAVNYWLVVVRPRRCAPGELCHVDSPTMRLNRWLFWLSVGIYAMAGVLTFASPLMIDRL